jgi:hypothetical protein
VVRDFGVVVSLFDVLTEQRAGRETARMRISLRALLLLVSILAFAVCGGGFFDGHY